MSKLFKKLSVLLFVFAIFVVFEAKNINVFADDMFEYVETFDSSNATGSYADGSFTGVNGVTWTYVHSRNEGDYPIDGKGIILRRNDEPSSLSATFQNGVGSFSFEYRKAFTGGTTRKYNVSVTDKVGSTITYEIPSFGGGSGEDATVHVFTKTLNMPGEVTIRIYAASNAQMTIDNFKWNEYSNEPDEPEGIIAKVTHVYDNDNQVTLELDAREYGQDLEIPVDAEGYTFAFWVVNGVVRKDLSNTSENFAVTEELEIQQVYYKEGEHAVLFVDSNGKLLKTEYVSNNASVSAPPTDNLSKPGYQVKSENKWLSNEGSSSLESINSSRVYVLQYEKVNLGQYTITVGEDTQQYGYNDIATVTAEVENFTHWEENGKVVSTSVEYSFTVTRNRTLVPVSNPELLNTSRVILSDDLEVRDGYQTFMAQIDLISGETIVEYGLVVSQNANDKYDDIDLETEAVEKAQGNVLHPITKEFVMSFDTKYHVVRAYLVTRDGEGNLTTVYSENQYSNAIIVNFNTGGVEGIENIVLVKQGKVTAPENPEKEYYIFDGWFADAELTIPFDFNQIITQDTTIYAKWLEDLPTIAEVRNVEIGEDVVFKGIVTAIDGDNVYVQDETAAIYLYNQYSKPVELSVGDLILVEGKRTDYGGLKEIDSNATITIESSGNTLPAIIDVDDFDMLTQEYQSRRVSISDVTVKSQSGNNLVLTNGTKDIMIYASNGTPVYTHIQTAIVGQQVVVHEAFVSWFNGLQLTILDVEKLEFIPFSDEDYVDIAAVEIEAEFDGKIFNMDTEANLPVEGPHGTTLTWSVEEPENAIVSGKWMVVEVDTEVLLSVTITKGDAVIEDLPIIITIKYIEASQVSAATFTFGDAKYTQTSTKQDGGKTMTVTGGGTLNVTISSSTAYWDDSANNSLRLGSSNNTGSNIFTFASSVKITKVTVYASQYNGPVSLNVDGQEQEITNATGSGYIGYEFVLNNLSSFTISSVKTSSSRLQVQKIVIEYAPQA